MKKWILHITIVGWLAVVLASCTSLVEDESGTSANEAQVMFTLALGDGAATRSATTEKAARDANTEIGDRYENTIDVANTRVLFYDVANNNFWGEVEGLTLQTSEAANIYHIIGQLKVQSPIVLGQSYKLKVVVLANCGSGSGIEYTFLKTLTYTYPLAGQTYIPMWGEQSYENIQFAPGKRTDLGTINILRAMAKVQIKSLTNDLSAVTLAGCNSLGTCLPASVGTDGYATTPTIPEGASKDKNALFTSTADGFIAYLPEQSKEDELTMKLTLDGVSYDLPLKDYLSAGKSFFDVVRNTYYVYNVSVVEKELEVKLLYKVEDWKTEKDIEIGFE